MDKARLLQLRANFVTSLNKIQGAIELIDGLLVELDKPTETKDTSNGN